MKKGKQKQIRKEEEGKEEVMGVGFQMRGHAKEGRGRCKQGWVGIMGNIGALEGTLRGPMTFPLTLLLPSNTWLSLISP